MNRGPISLKAARAEVLSRASPLPVEPVPLDRALGRTLGEPAVAGQPVQGFDNSQMDGFAVQAADTASAGERSPAVAESSAGHPPQRGLGSGEAITISTGAMLPAGADAVVRVEDTDRDGEALQIFAQVLPGTHVRRRGEDIAGGSTVLEPGTRLGAAELGVLASLGGASVRCHRQPRLAVVTCGDELVQAGEELTPGAIHDSNALSIPALATLSGADVVSIGWMPDETAATRATIAASLDADVVVICGGVSVGKHDHVKGALAELGVEQAFWRVALKPGQPTWFGSRPGALVFGLPGNPVSAMVAFLFLVRPALARLNGSHSEHTRTIAVLDNDCDTPAGRTRALRCRLELKEDGWHARIASNQGSHILTSMLDADALALVPAQTGALRAGERLEVELLGAG
jgi:molybdopterin molybdotransferase